MRSVSLRYIFPILAIIFLFISNGLCLDDDEDDEEYDEELADGETTTSRKYHIRTSTKSTTSSSVIVAANANVSRADGNVTEKASPAAAETLAVTPAATPPVQAQASPPPAVRVTQRPRATAATTLSEDDEDFEPTEEEGYGYIFRPLNSLVDNIVAGNVTGIVDHALSIRTPPEIRQFVNHVMSNVFNSGVSGALKSYLPAFFSTQAPPLSARDPIPARPRPRPPTRRFPSYEPIPSGVIESRSNSTGEGAGTTKKQTEVAIKVHPGAPASRLRCEVIS